MMNVIMRPIDYGYSLSTFPSVWEMISTHQLPLSLLYSHVTISHKVKFQELAKLSPLSLGNYGLKQKENASPDREA